MILIVFSFLIGLVFGFVFRLLYLPVATRSLSPQTSILFLSRLPKNDWLALQYSGFQLAVAARALS